MKFNIALCVLCLAMVGCSTASKKAESLHSIETFNDQGQLAYREIWRDRSKGGGTGFLSDPKATAIDSRNINQTGLGGGSAITVGDYQSKTSVDGIKATGDAVGGVVNSAVTGK